MKTILMVTALWMMATLVFSQDVQRTVTDKRQTVQRARIAEGRIDGDLTRGETRALRKEQRHIRRAERRAEADGVVTGREKARLNRKQNRANRHIRRAKNNNVENN